MGSELTESGDVSSGLRAAVSPAVSVMTEGSRETSPRRSSETRWPTSSAVLEVVERLGERPLVPQGGEGGEGGLPLGSLLTGWRRKASAPEFPSWRELGWAPH